MLLGCLRPGGRPGHDACPEALCSRSAGQRRASCFGRKAQVRGLRGRVFAERSTSPPRHGGKSLLPTGDRKAGAQPRASPPTIASAGPTLCEERWIAARFGELMTEIVRTGAVGAYVPMVDGPEKVSGRAKYAADFIAPQMLTGRIYRSPYAHAEIIDVDTSQAAKVPGVVAIITGADCANTFGVLPIARTEHPLARDKVRYKGEPVAAVAAVDAATADKAIRLISMKVRELPAYYTASAALAADAMTIHDKKPGNLEREVLFELGSVADGFAKAHLVSEATYNCAEVCQNQMEMHAAVAEYDSL